MSQSMDHSEYASIVREVLSHPADNLPKTVLDEQSKRNAANCMTMILSNRLSQSGSPPEPRSHTTFQWKDGLVNFRNAVRGDLWTNLRLSFTEQMHLEAVQRPVTYVMAAWPPFATTMHVWTIPENVVYGALPYHEVSKNGEKRTIEILSTRHHFERCQRSPDLKPYYRLLPLSEKECVQLDAAARADQLVRNRKIDGPAVTSGAVPAPQQRAWIFQANPQIYDVVEALKHLDRVRWSVRQHKDEIHSGDRAYIWVSGAHAGVVASGWAMSLS